MRHSRRLAILYFIAGFFVVIAIGSQLKKSNAEDGASEKTTEEKTKANKESSAERATEKPDKVKTNGDISGIGTDVPSNEDMYRALIEKEESLKREEARLQALRGQLSKEEEEINKKISEYSKIQEKIEGLYDQSKNREDEIFKKLLTAVEKMEASKSSAIITLMEDKLAVEVLLGMKEKTVAKILNAMDTQRAMVLSTKIADRKPATQFRKEGGKPTP